MRICIVARRFSATWGGAERVAVNLARRLHDAGHQVQIITAASDVDIEGMNIRTIRVNTLLSPWKILSFQRQVKRILRNEHYDLVYGLCHVYPLDIYRLSDGIHRHWMKVRYPNPVLRWTKYLTSLINPTMTWIEGRMFKERNCSFFITNSQLIKNQVVEYFHVPEKRIQVVYNGVDHALFNPGVKAFRNAQREQYGIGDERVLFFAGNNWERKGLSAIIDAMPDTGIKNMKLVIAGRGKKDRYVSLARERGISPDAMIFAGQIKDIEKYYGMSDIFVLPTKYEPFANVCLEAMACGIPVITTKTNGAAELITPGENGFILGDWRDSRRLAEIILLLNDENILKRIGDNAARTAGNYTWERHVEETNRIFELLGSQK